VKTDERVDAFLVLDEVPIDSSVSWLSIQVEDSDSWRGCSSFMVSIGTDDGPLSLE
jgi:hypothetical protein